MQAKCCFSYQDTIPHRGGCQVLFEDGKFCKTEGACTWRGYRIRVVFESCLCPFSSRTQIFLSEAFMAFLSLLPEKFRLNTFRLTKTVPSKYI
jgi:hypothetical protein